MSRLKIKFKDEKAYYSVHNQNDELLGYIEFCKKWKTWVFSPEECTMFSSGCLGVINMHLRDISKKFLTLESKLECKDNDDRVEPV